MAAFLGEVVNDRLSVLEPEFREMADLLLCGCLVQGITMIPFSVVRTPIEQAKLWRQSRATAQIKRAVTFLRSMSAHYLADCIESVGPQHGRCVTYHIPGASMHQWGLAMDCYWFCDGDAEWSTIHKNDEGFNGYKVYTKTATAMGLNAGGAWRSFKDYCHVDRMKDFIKIKKLSYEDISREMERRFGNAAV